MRKPAVDAIAAPSCGRVKSADDPANHNICLGFRIKYRKLAGLKYAFTDGEGTHLSVMTGVIQASRQAESGETLFLSAEPSDTYWRPRKSHRRARCGPAAITCEVQARMCCICQRNRPELSSFIACDFQTFSIPFIVRQKQLTRANLILVGKKPFSDERHTERKAVTSSPSLAAATA